MALYEITYAIIPPGVGPDDYEPADLERRTETVDLPDPEPAGLLPDDSLLTYGPPMPDVHQALASRIPPGAKAAVLRMEIKRG